MFFYASVIDVYRQCIVDSEQYLEEGDPKNEPRVVGVVVLLFSTIL